MAKKKKGLRVGNYQLTPLGLGMLIALIVIVAALVVLLVVKPFGASPDVQQVSGGSNTKAPAPAQTIASTEDTEPTPTPKPTATPAPKLKSATIRALGEIAMENALLKSVYDATDKTFDFAPMFSEISSVMSDADYTIADVESTLGDSVGSYSGTSSKMIAPSALLSTLADNGVDMLMLANEHIFDGGLQELQATIAKCEEYGLDYVGAHASADDKDLPVIKTINGIKVGFVAYTEKLNGHEKKATSKDNAFAVNLVSKSNAVADIQNARIAGADVIVALMNWGDLGKRNITSSQQQIAKVLCGAGADVIIGYNPHVVQPLSWLEVKNASGTTNRTLCLGATGNFLSNQREQYMDSGIVFEFTIQEQEDGSYAIESPVYIPTYVWRYEDASGGYQYRTLAVGDWVGEAAQQPEGMSYTDYTRLCAVWAEIQSVMESSPATISNQ